MLSTKLRDTTKFSGDRVSTIPTAPHHFVSKDVTQKALKLEVFLGSYANSSAWS